MRIAVDIRDLAFAKTGIRTVHEELIKGLQNQHGDVVLLKPNSLAPPQSRIAKIVEHLKYFWWKQYILPKMVRRSGSDVLLCNDYVAPYFTRGFKAFPFFHGTNFWEFKSHYNPVWRRYFSFMAVSAAKRSARIVVNSLFTKKKLEDVLGIPGSKVSVIPLGPKSLNVSEDRTFLTSRNLTAQGYLLHVGVMEKRKNLVNLIKAFSLIEGTDKKLVLIGQRGPKNDMDDYQNIVQTIQDLGIQDKVMLTGHVSEGELLAAYRHAALLVFPSKYEGFGIPVLEALQHGIPVVTSRYGAFLEILGKDWPTFNADNPTDIARVVQKILDDSYLRNDLVNKGEQVLLKYNWNNSVKELLAIFQDAD